MDRLRTIVAGTLIVYATGFASLSTASGRQVGGMHLLDGKLYVDERLVLDGISVMRTERGYLFFYIPDVGLVTVGTTPFLDARSSGRFEGATIRFSANGRKFQVDASRSILDGDTSPAWVRVDPRYSLETASPMMGYGDTLSTPYRWPRQVRHAD